MTTVDWVFQLHNLFSGLHLVRYDMWQLTTTLILDNGVGDSFIKEILGQGNSRTDQGVSGVRITKVVRGETLLIQVEVPI